MGATGRLRSSVGVSRSQKGYRARRRHAHRPYLSRVVPGPARGVRRHRARRRAARGGPRRRRARRHALRVRRLADAGPPRGRVPDGAERVDRAHVLGDAARSLCAAPVGELRRAPRPHGSSRTCARWPPRDSLLSHGARAARRPAGPPVRGRDRALDPREAHLHLDEPAQAEAGPPVDRELRECARSLRVPVQAKVRRRVPRLPRAHEPRQGRTSGARGRARDRLASQDRREMPGAARDPLLRRVHPSPPRRLDRVRGGGRPRRQGRAPDGRSRAHLTRSTGRSRSA